MIPYIGTRRRCLGKSAGTTNCTTRYLFMQVPVTDIDRKLARLATDYSCEPLEKCLQFVTKVADEKVLVPGSLVAWIIATLQNAKPNRYKHLLVTLIIITAFDHFSKHVFDQRRPNRTRKRYRKRGIPYSPGKYNLLPSGHAMRLGQRREHCKEPIRKLHSSFGVL